ncbi:hypothetical protein SUGI_1017200 [Cryptomeria japonica]|nr:hypothetical protein SUGI_1017200 [Cryptomeria japonica]
MRMALFASFFSMAMGTDSNNYMEARNICIALKKASEKKLKKIICETDSLIIITLLNGDKAHNSSCHLPAINLSEEILHLVTMFKVIPFVYIAQEWKAVANFLANWRTEENYLWDALDWDSLIHGKKAA